MTTKQDRRARKKAHRRVRREPTMAQVICSQCWLKQTNRHGSHGVNAACVGCGQLYGTYAP